jgi:pimeloyl-ACP methyl ester carboxylesterase
MDSISGDQSDIGVIFLSGAGLQGWIWEKVREKINAPSMTIDFSALDKNSSLNDYTNTALEQVDRLGVAKFIIVGHSIGGVVGSELAKKLGKRLVGFIGVCAVIPEPGEAYLSAFPLQQRLMMKLIFKLAGTRPPESMIRKGLCAGIHNEDTDRVVRDFRQEAVRLYTDSTSTTPLPKCPNLYICTSADKDLPLSLQGRIARNLSDVTIATVDSGHLPMLSHPGEVTTYINDFLS